MPTRIALIHATPLAMAPVTQAFATHWPAAELINVLDDTLSRDRATSDLTPALSDRIGCLADDALSAGADGILYTCSAFGPAIEAVAGRLRVPVLGPNDAMLDAALDAGERIGLLATFEPTLPAIETELRARARQRSKSVHPLPCLAAGALEALTVGDEAGHNRLCAGAAVEIGKCDVIALAQFSMTPASESVASAAAVKTLNGPESAVLRLRSIAGSSNSQ